MKNVIQYIILAGVFSTSVGCEKTIKVDLPQEKEKLVINSESFTGDTLKISVSKSEALLKYRYGRNLDIPGAEIKLYEGGKEIDRLEYDPGSQLYVSHTKTEIGKVYSIKANAPGFTEISASSEALVPVNILSVSRSFKVRLDIDGIEQDEIKLEFNDPEATEDYYMVRILKPNDSNNYFYCVNTSDASVESIYDENIDQNTCIPSDGIFIRDNLFNGSKKELRIFLNSYYLQPDTVMGEVVYPQIELLHVTEDYYKYQKSYHFGLENFNNPFSEPVNVYTNIKNGYGIFSLISADAAEIK